MKLKTIDPTAEEYIDWTIHTLSEGWFDTVIESVIIRIKEYYTNTDREIIIADLRAKMTAGAIQHGKLPTSINDIDRELQQEYLDIIAYNMMIYFVSSLKLAQGSKERI